MSISRRLPLNILVLLVSVEGHLFTDVSSSSVIKADDVEQFQPTILEKYGGISGESISKRSVMQFRNFSNYFQGGGRRMCNSCGLSNSKRKNFLVIQGEMVEPPYRYPWMVRLESVAWCTGSIISEYYILTAAHCLVKSVKSTKEEYVYPKDVTVKFLTETYEMKPGPKVEKIFPHPKFSLQSKKNDIALIKLKNKIKCDKFKNPICLPPSNFRIRDGMKVKIAGWGVSTPGSDDPSRILKEGTLRYVKPAKCHELSNTLKKTVYCFEGLKRKYQSACKGDSGGPVFYEHGNKYYVLGVNSFGTSKTCVEGTKSMATAVPKFLNWIKKVMTSSSKGR